QHIQQQKENTIVDTQTEQTQKYATGPDKIENRQNESHSIYNPQHSSEQQQKEIASAEKPDINIFDFNDTCISKPTTFTLPEAPEGYQITWEENPRSDSLRINISGIYKAHLLDDKGNIIDSGQFSLRYMPEPQVDLPKRHSSCKGKTLKLDPGFYEQGYQFQWSDGAESPVNFVSSPEEGEKVLQLTITGCKPYHYQTTVSFKPCELNIPNVITPNGDGINDYFVIEGLSNYPGSKLVILDRNGNEVYSSENYQNDFNGENLPKGAYLYILKVNNKSQTIKQGTLNIYY
ncbi:MAG: gliding motility-associated C-terminal domain-containing protein, partial [Bacteroidales bacterium]